MLQVLVPPFACVLLGKSDRVGLEDWCCYRCLQGSGSALVLQLKQLKHISAVNHKSTSSAESSSPKFLVSLYLALFLPASASSASFAALLCVVCIASCPWAEQQAY